MIRRAAVMLATLLALAQARAERSLHAAVLGITRVPIGWLQFCSDNPDECRGGPSWPRDIDLTPAAWRKLAAVNTEVNATVKPMTDLEHWRTPEKWSLPLDGFGDCEDYALLKRKLLISAGWPRAALLITVVRDRQAHPHTVLTVTADQGDYILDNQTGAVLTWFDTGYRFVKRQSQDDPNVWVSLGDPTFDAATGGR